MVAPTKITRGRRPIRQTGPRASAIEPTPPRAQTNHRGGFVALRRDHHPPTTNIFPTPPTHPTPTNGLRRPRRGSSILLRPSTDSFVHPPRMRAIQGRAQREWGVVNPGAQLPTTGHRVERGREDGGGTSKGGGARSDAADGGGDIHLPPTPELSGPAELRDLPPLVRQRPSPIGHDKMRAAEGFGCHFQGWRQHNLVWGGDRLTSRQNLALQAQYRVQGCDVPTVRRTDHGGEAAERPHDIARARARTRNTCTNS